MAKIIFLFKNLKVITTTEQELQDYETFLNSKEYDTLAKAYEEASKIYKFA